MALFSVRANTSREWLVAAMVISSGWAEVLLSFPLLAPADRSTAYRYQSLRMRMVWFSVRVNTSREWLVAAMVIFSGFAEVLLSFLFRLQLIDLPPTGTRA
jgi:hypothetical protein